MDPNLIRVEKVGRLEAARMGCPGHLVQKRGYGVFYGSPSVYGCRERFAFTKREAETITKAWTEELNTAGRWTTATAYWNIIIRGEVVYRGVNDDAERMREFFQDINPGVYVLVEYGSR